MLWTALPQEIVRAIVERLTLASAGRLASTSLENQLAVANNGRLWSRLAGSCVVPNPTVAALRQMCKRRAQLAVREQHLRSAGRVHGSIAGPDLLPLSSYAISMEIIHIPGNPTLDEDFATRQPELMHISSAAGMCIYDDRLHVPLSTDEATRLRESSFVETGNHLRIFLHNHLRIFLHKCSSGEMVQIYSSSLDGLGPPEEPPIRFEHLASLIATPHELLGERYESMTFELLPEFILSAGLGTIYEGNPGVTIQIEAQGCTGPECDEPFALQERELMHLFPCLGWM